MGSHGAPCSAARSPPPRWEPAGRDRASLLRNEAERHGARGKGPCLWYRLADMDRGLGQPLVAAADERRAYPFARERCPRTWF